MVVISQMLPHICSSSISESRVHVLLLTLSNTPCVALSWSTALVWCLGVSLVSRSLSGEVS